MMVCDKKLREAIRSQISACVEAVNAFEIVHAGEYSEKPRVIDFDLRDFPEEDCRKHSELEINVYGPASNSDTVEATSAQILDGLDGSFCLLANFAFYIYKENRNRIDGGDGHTVRYRCTFDLYLYERM